MKKINKKQKSIVIISSLILVIVVIILITTNIIINNSQINNEEYLAITSGASSNLIAKYIKKGVKVGSITGTFEVLDTSDATATASDIKKGKTAYVNGIKITGTYIENTLGTVTGNENTNSEVNDKYGNKVKVPAGFKVINPNDDVTKGIIIEDVSAGDSYKKGSQFVWIPVGDIIIDSKGTIKTISLGRYDFNSSGGTTSVSRNYTEDTYNNHNFSCENTIAKDIEDFLTKATLSGGYYIGRYEIGDATATESKHTDSGITNPMTCRGGVYPYNFITQTQASYLCQNMYNSNNFESDLINSYSWDTAIVFLQMFSGDENYSRQSGKNTNDTFQKAGESILVAVDDGDEAQDVRCNIFDMAGNTFEWTTETYNNESYSCVWRGSYYHDTLDYTGLRICNQNSSAYNVYLSGRPIIYL